MSAPEFVVGWFAAVALACLPWPTMAGAGNPGAAASTGKMAVVEIVDLSCAHCAAFAATADALAARVRAAGGVFRVAPIQPLAGGDNPSSAVLAVYEAELGKGDVFAQKVADALYGGFHANAALASPQGVGSWLMTQGIDWHPAETGKDAAARTHFARAVVLAAGEGVREFPALIFLDLDTGRVTHRLTWTGSVATLRAKALTALGIGER